MNLTIFARSDQPNPEKLLVMPVQSLCSPDCSSSYRPMKYPLALLVQYSVERSTGFFTIFYNTLFSISQIADFFGILIFP